ncbi:kinase domain protein (macronuclear) [Tetrahymena thermophila SB210]|uniref:Kinase domain protein n=1 Tax=Tetrahymena thermophila (strain SB210) TaxID=312017 RepID=I7MIK3_TETTS|nr:kinase domain protein [Tetrahymena thermophila SB210]EAS04523.1 kinase domain protein [Tetrahymena thermophila SB210]|eukprot:XP_001024768.1 kinase domain protein [Tetrahymena thermophila SB210]
MGAAGPKLSKSEVQLVDQKRYQREPSIPFDIRYGDQVKIYKQLDSAQRVAIIQKVFDTQMQYQVTVDIQKSLSKLKHPGLIQLLNIVTKKKEQLCSQFFKVKFLYEYVDNDLQKDLEQRRQLEKDLKSIPQNFLTSIEDLKVSNSTYKIFYEESELWYIMATVIAVLSYLKERNLIHGDIRPFNLCLTKDNALKVMTINSFIQTNWSSYMEKLEKLDTQSTYISPIQLGALQHNIQRPVHNIPKSDLFCLGVIILELCLLESAQDIYDFTTFSIDLSARVKKLRDLKKYSEAFIDFLLQLLVLNEEKRKNPEDLYQILAELAKSQQISVSNRIFSHERVALLVNKWKQKNQLNVNFDAVLTQQNAANNPAQQQQQQKALDLILTQQQGFVLPEKIFENEGGQENKNNETIDEMPNQEEGEIIQELGLLSKNENRDNNSNSFSIQKSANNISPNQRQSEENKNNLSNQSIHHHNNNNESLNRIKKDLSGEFRNVENKENIFQGKGNQNHLSNNISATNLFDQNNLNNNLQQQQGGLFSRSQSQHFPNQQNQNNKLNFGSNNVLQNTSNLLQNSNNNNNNNNLLQNNNNLLGQFNNNNNNMFFGQIQQNQFGQSQFSNNLNMNQGGNISHFGANLNNQNQFGSNNNGVFGLQNFNSNQNNQFQQFSNQNISKNSFEQNVQLLNQLLQYRNINNPNMMQGQISDQQINQLVFQLQQMASLQQQQNIPNNQMQHIPQLDFNQLNKNNSLFGNFGNSNSQQLNMSPTFNGQQNINFQMNRAGGYSNNNQSNLLAQNTSFYSNNNFGGNNNISNFNSNNNNQFSSLNQNTVQQNQIQGQLNILNTQQSFNPQNNNNNILMQNNNNNTSQNNNNTSQNQNANIFNVLNNQPATFSNTNIGNNNQNQNPTLTNIAGGGGQSSQTNIFSRNNRSIF